MARVKAQRPDFPTALIEDTPTHSRTLSGVLDSLLRVPLRPEEVDSEIAATEARLRLLRALKGEVSPTRPALPSPRRKTESEDPVARWSPDPKEDAPEREALELRVGAYLRMNGPKRRDSIRNSLECDDLLLSRTLALSKFFLKEGGMWGLSSEGEARFRRDDDE